MSSSGVDVEMVITELGELQDEHLSEVMDHLQIQSKLL